MAELREIIMDQKELRKIIIQPHMYLDPVVDGNGDGSTMLRLQTFPVSPEGMVGIFLAQYPVEDPELLTLYKADKVAMTDKLTD